MKPLALTLRGIGPFVETQYLDFSLLDEKALFLIHGPTGQGKSFIFDALCYALYADTPSDREGHLKSDYLADDIEPFVDFSFSLGSGKYRVRRSLRYERPKKRGVGTTLQDDSHLLMKLGTDGTETVLAEKRNEVDARIRDIMGLDAGQFRQVVMIPQGEFRKLLLADSSERESLLERLFDASLYRDIQERLQENENSIKQAFEDQQREVERLEIERSGIYRAEDIGLAETSPDESVPDSQQTRLEILLTAKIKGLNIAAVESASALTKVLSRQQLDRALAEDYEKMRLLKMRQEGLEIQRQDMETLAVRLEQDKRAFDLKDRLQEALRARRVLEDSITESHQSRLRLDELGRQNEALKESESRIPGWQEELSGTKSRLKLMDAFNGESRRREALENESEEIETLLASAQAGLTDLDKQEKILEQRRAELDGILSENADTRSRSGNIADRRQVLTELLRVHDLRIRSEETKTVLVAEQNTAAGLRDAVTANWKHLQARKEASLAGYLAASLEDEKPCPVCGSTHHPSPNKFAEDQPDEAEMQTGERAALDSESAIAELTGRMESLESRFTEINKNIEEYQGNLGLDGSENLQEVLADLDARDALLKKADTERRQLVERDIPMLLQNRQDAAVRLENARSRKEGVVRSLGEQETRWKAVLEKWGREFDEPAPVLKGLDEKLSVWREAVDGLEKQLRNLEMKRVQMQGNLENAETEFKEKDRHRERTAEDNVSRDKSLTQGLRESGFEDEATLAAFLEEAGDVDSSRRRIAEWEAGLKNVVTLLSDLEERIAGKALPDLDAVSVLCDEQRQLDEAAREKLATSRASLNRLETVGRELEDLEKEGREAALRQGVMLRLSQQVRGNIAPKISLKRFFLARRLEEVLVQATLRLSLLSQGRFILCRRDEGKTAAAQAGLDLMVADSWTGTERPVNTLSGGQLFMASLSLALGLADVVQARSGGVRLEALFIDEGFGTLDDEALQGVLKVLNDLRENRMVGVISHVPELKRQIADRIDVAAVAVGSSARLIVGS